MPRPPRCFVPDAVYHLTSRGSNRRATFRDDRDRALFMALVRKAAERFDWSAHAWCLMTNHYHLLLSAPAGISAGMKLLNGGYAQAFNRRHGGEAHVFRNRFGAEPVERDEHLLAAARYIVLNPVRAGMCRRPEQWPWSSFRACAGLERAPRFLSFELVLGVLDPRPAVAFELYRAFVDQALEPVSDTRPKTSHPAPGG